MTGTRLALVAPLSGGRPGTIPDVFERLGPLLAADHDVLLTSTAAGRLRRATAMATSVHGARRDLDAVVIHLYSGRALVIEDLVSRVARRADVPLIGVLAGGGLPAHRDRHPRWVSSVLERFDVLVAPSEHLGRWGRDLGRPTTVIANPLDVEDYEYRRRTRARPRLFWMRAYHEIYRPMVALDVLEHVRRVHPDALLTMAGPDKGLRADVEAEVTARGLGEAVDVAGFVDADAKRRMFADHDIFLNTPAVDNRPVCVIEAAASGLAVVSTDAGGIPALVEHDRSALLAPVDDATRLGDAVLRLLADPALVARITDGGLRVADEGRPERVRRAWETLLLDVTGAGSP